MSTAPRIGDEGKGVLVQDVKGDSPAAKEGFESGDIIVALDGKPSEDATRFRMEIARMAPGTSVTLDVRRKGVAKAFTVVLGELEAPATAGAPTTSATARLGLTLQDATPEMRQRLGLDEGATVVITNVAPGSSAARAGVRPGDLLERIGDTPVTDATSAARELRATADDGVRVRLRRGDGLFVILEGARRQELTTRGCARARPAREKLDMSPRARPRSLRAALASSGSAIVIDPEHFAARAWHVHEENRGEAPPGPDVEPTD